jgi:hypothetical protein
LHRRNRERDGVKRNGGRRQGLAPTVDALVERVFSVAAGLGEPGYRLAVIPPSPFDAAR